MHQNKKTWDTIAESFDKTRKKTWKPCIDFIEQIKEKKITADISCGNGRHLFPLAKKSKKTIGLDISKNMLRIVKKKIQEQKIENIELIEANAVNIPLKNNTIDHLIYIAALHNIKGRQNRIKSLKEIKRILKKQGNALISVWSREQDRFRDYSFEENISKEHKLEYGDILLYWRQDEHNIPRFYHLYSGKEFKEDLEKSGLEIIDFKAVKIVSKNYPDNFFAVVK